MLTSWLKSLFANKTKPQLALEWIWADSFKKLLEPRIELLNQAIDVSQLHPKYKSLTREQQLVVWGEFFKWLSYYESGWNPKSASVDVGSKFDRNTWSIGLLQMSVVDQKNLGLYLDFDYDSLLMPLPNLTLGLAVMVNQIQKRKKIFIPKSEKGNPSVYWATLNPGNQYDKSDLILAKTKAIAF